jgi:hypothetical protein
LSPCEKISARTRARSPSKILGRLTGVHVCAAPRAVSRALFAPCLAPCLAPFCAAPHAILRTISLSRPHSLTAPPRALPRPKARPARSTTPASEPRPAAARTASEALWICARAPFLAPFRAPPLAPFRAPCAGHWSRHSRRARLGPEHAAARRLEIIPREPPRALEFAPAVVGARPERCAVSERHPAPSKGLSRRAWRREGCTGPAPRVRRTQASRRAWRRAGLHRAQLPVSDVARAGAQQASLEARGAAPAPLPMSDVARARGRSRRASTRAQLLCPTWRALHGPAGEPGGARGYTAPSSRVRRGARCTGPAGPPGSARGCTGPAPCPAWRARAGAAGPPRRGPSSPGPDSARAAPAQLPVFDVSPAPRFRRGARARRGPSSPCPTRRALHRPSRRAWRRGAALAQLPVSDVERAHPAGEPRRGPRSHVRRGARGPAGEPGGARGCIAPNFPCPTWRARGPSRRAWRRAGLYRPRSLCPTWRARAGAAGEPRREPNSYVRRGARCTAQQASLEARGATPRPAPVSDVARARGRGRPASTRTQLPVSVSDVARAGPAGEPGGARGCTGPAPCPTWRARAQQA